MIEEATARYEMPEGVFVTNVLEDTAAEKAGILKGDIITYIDGEKITGMDRAARTARVLCRRYRG